MANKLLELCDPIISLIAAFYHGERGEKLSSDYDNHIFDAIKALETQALAQQISTFDLKHIKFAMIAFIDEGILNSASPLRSKWMSNPLQLQYLGEHTAGATFFQHISELRQAGTKYLDLLEIYYVCLKLGFQGMYRWHEPEKLSAIKENLQQQIEIAHDAVDITPACALPQQTTLLQKSKLFLWLLAGGFGLLFCIYLVFSFIINHEANKAVNEITASRDQLMQNYNRIKP